VTAGPSATLPRGVTAPIPRELLRLALPVLVSQLMRIAYQWVDALWVRGLGIEATASVTTSMFVMWSVYSLHDVFGLGVAAYVSQLLGAGQRQRAGLASYQGLRAVLVTGLVCAAIGAPAATSIYRFMKAPPGVIEQGGHYLRIMLAASPLPMLGFTAETIMRASGNTRLPLTLDVLAVSLNAVLDPLLIYGWGPFPRLGVAGAALATAIAQALLVVCYVIVALRGHEALPLARRAPGGPINVFGLARVGLPAALVGMMFSLVYVAFSRSAARFGAASLAIVGIANRIEAVQFVVGVSLGIAGASLVGQNLGAGRPDRASLTVRTALVWGGWVSTALTIVLFAFPAAFLTLFTRDSETLRIGVPYLRILSLCLIATGLEIITNESIQGSGHTRTLSIIYNSFSIIRVPLCFVVPGWFGSGVLGIAWLITITCVARSSLILAWAARGTWKRGLAGELHGAPVGATSPDAPA
jgi:putative MATE family efflux protein